MKIFKKVSVVIFVVAFLFNLTGSSTVFAATTPSLGVVTTFGVLASTYTNTIAGTTINGDVGFTTGPTVAPAGTHTNYGSGDPYASAGIAQGSTLSTLNAETCDFNFDSATDLSLLSQPLTSGVYCITGATSIGTGGITLSGSGTYLFRISGALTSVANSIVTLAGGASACNVFWTPSAATTLAANTIFAGTVIDDAGITVGANTIWTGRALAFGGTITTDNDTITAPTCTLPIPPVQATLHIIKQVVNNDGGIATASLFNLHVKLSGNDVTGSPAVGTTTPGTSYSLSAGTYVVSEDANTSYTKSFSGDCDSNGSVTLSAGDNKICTITNDDIAVVVVLPTSTINNDIADVVVLPTSTDNIVDVVVLPTSTLITAPVVPNLPNTGVNSDEKNISWGIGLLVGIIILVSTSLGIVIKKRTI